MRGSHGSWDSRWFPCEQHTQGVVKQVLIEENMWREKRGVGKRMQQRALGKESRKIEKCL